MFINYIETFYDFFSFINW